MLDSYSASLHSCDFTRRLFGQKHQTLGTHNKINESKLVQIRFIPLNISFHVVKMRS